MASELCMNCFGVKGQYEVCPYCGYIEGTPPKQPHYLTPGTILNNHFIVGTVIGFGGFGITYKCFDTTLGVIVAAKEFYPIGLVNRAPGESRVGLLSGNKREQYRNQMKRFLLEAQSVAQFGKARDIVNVYDFFEENGTAYIIMEYVDGVLLKDYLDRQGAMPPDVAVNVTLTIIEAVKKIHSKGIIHRDLSPDNIFISSEDTIKVFDFGAAQINDSKEGMAGEKIIKAGYSAPEQYRDKSKQGFYTDVYSVGTILYQMLTGRKPAESTEREYKDTLKSPLELGIQVNANIDRAVMEAIAVRPEFRFQDIRQFEEALKNKRLAEYPKDKLKKKKRFRNGVIAGTAGAAAAVIIVVALLGTVLDETKKNPIFADTIAGKETTLQVWVENEDQKADLEKIAKELFAKNASSTQDESVQEEVLSAENSAQDESVQADTKNEDSSSIDQSVKAMMEDSKDVNVIITVHPDIEKDLNKIKSDSDTVGEASAEAENASMPTLFMTDHVTDPERYELSSLDDVYSLLETDQYICLEDDDVSQYNRKQIPTGIDTLLLYACDFEYNEKNTLNQSAWIKENANTVRLKELIASGEEKDFKEKTINQELNNKLATFVGDYEGYALLLQSGNEEEALSAENESLKKIHDFEKEAESKTYMISPGRKTGIYGSNIVAGAAFRKKLDVAVKDTEGEVQSKKDDINVLKDNGYRAYVVVDENERMLVIHAERYAISQKASHNQKIAAERLLWYMMQGDAQDLKSLSKEEAYPILKVYFKETAAYNSQMKSFVDLATDADKISRCKLIGQGTGTVHNFMTQM